MLPVIHLKRKNRLIQCGKGGWVIVVSTSIGSNDDVDAASALVKEHTSIAEGE
jgi:hypothetical protein